MKVKAIRLREVGPFRQPVALEGFSGDLDVLIGENEFGKSTLFRALKSVFFLKHTSTRSEVDELRSERGGDPLIEVDFEKNDAVWRISKQFGKSKRAVLENIGSSDVWRGADAENKLSKLIGLRDGQTGAFGLVWVAQKGGLSPPYPDPEYDLKRQQGKDLGERSALMRAIETEIEAVSGGGLARAVRARVRKELGELVTVKGTRARKDGDLDEAERRLEGVQNELEEASAVAQQTAKTVEELVSVRERHKAKSDPEFVSALSTAVADAQTKLDGVQKLKRDFETAKNKRELARELLRAAGSRLKLFDEKARELADLEEVSLREQERVTEFRLKISEHGKALEQSRSAGESLSKDVEEIGHRQIVRAQADQRDNAKKQLEGRSRTLEAVEKLSLEIEAASNALRSDRVTSAQVNRLEDLLRQIDGAENRLKVATPEVDIAYAKGASKRFRIDGVKIEENKTFALRERVVLEVEDVGRVTVSPGQSADRAAQEEIVARGRAELEKILKALKVSDVAVARASLEERQAREGALATAKGQLNVLAPDGIDALRSEVAELTSSVGEDVKAELSETAEEIESKLSGTREQLEAARRSYAKLNSHGSALGEELALAQGQAKERVKRIEVLSGELGRAEKRALQRNEFAELFETAKTKSNELERLVAALQEGLPDPVELSRLEEDAKTAKAAVEKNGFFLQQLDVQLAQLSEKMAAADRAGDGAKVDSLKAELVRAQDDVARARAKVASLQLLDDVLAEAGEQARDQVVGPVAARVRPYLESIFPGAELALGDGFRIKDLKRDGDREPLHRLSDGTQEQLGVLVRLGFARVLADAGMPLPFILDDPLAYSDDKRIAGIIDALIAASRIHQVIVFVRRNEIFERLGGTQLALQPWHAAA